MSSFPISLLSQLTKQNLIAQKIVIPPGWKDHDDPDQYDLGFESAELKVSINPPDTLFQSATLNRYHVDAAKQLSDAFSVYIDGISNAIGSGIDAWMRSCAVTGVSINASVGMVAPGSLVGPALAPLILANAPMMRPQEIAYSNAIANTFGSAWDQWSGLLCGQLMYPSFAMVALPMAPPTPNLPVALASFSSSGEAQLSAPVLKLNMENNLGDKNALHASNLFDALSEALAQVFVSFKKNTMVQNVLGAGPVPAYAPPVIAGGAVVGGVGNGTACLV